MVFDLTFRSLRHEPPSKYRDDVQGAISTSVSSIAETRNECACLHARVSYTTPLIA